MTDRPNLVPLKPQMDVALQHREQFITNMVEALRRADVAGIPLSRVLDPSPELDLIRSESRRPDGRLVELPPVEGWATFTLRSAAEAYRLPYVRWGRCEAGHDMTVVSSLPIGDARCYAEVERKGPFGRAQREACGAQVQP